MAKKNFTKDTNKKLKALTEWTVRTLFIESTTATLPKYWIVGYVDVPTGAYFAAGYTAVPSTIPGCQSDYVFTVVLPNPMPLPGNYDTITTGLIEIANGTIGNICVQGHSKGQIAYNKPTQVLT